MPIGIRLTPEDVEWLDTFVEGRSYHARQAIKLYRQTLEQASDSPQSGLGVSTKVEKGLNQGSNGDDVPQMVKPKRGHKPKGGS
ncbi:hypothetical protein RIF25_15935 [Thermosynechococcaceae cyanobacterium BACA0444]|uniref:Uncharacterized protein n=1 Tax=Pseudocalidococcus azoricus BACA0444 TaxID=2918990 RepID=A0AAE4JX94_9CYAN|nr:hypothetical protein [Pseudocalidococcus azoricus BACA0444]